MELFHHRRRIPRDPRALGEGCCRGQTRQQLQQLDSGKLSPRNSVHLEALPCLPGEFCLRRQMMLSKTDLFRLRVDLAHIHVANPSLV